MNLKNAGYPYTDKGIQACVKALVEGEILYYGEFKISFDYLTMSIVKKDLTNDNKPASPIDDIITGIAGWQVEVPWEDIVSDGEPIACWVGSNSDIALIVSSNKIDTSGVVVYEDVSGRVHTVAIPLPAILSGLIVAEYKSRIAK